MEVHLQSWCGNGQYRHDLQRLPNESLVSVLDLISKIRLKLTRYVRSTMTSCIRNMLLPVMWVQCVKQF